MSESNILDTRPKGTIVAVLRPAWWTEIAAAGRVCEGLRVGNASAVSRLALIARLEETAQGGPFQWEVNRRARVVEELDRTRRLLAARRVRIPAAADVEDRRLRDLSGDIALKPGELRIEFYGAEDLAAKLLELSKAMANDWPAFARAVEDGGKEAAASRSVGLANSLTR